MNQLLTQDQIESFERDGFTVIRGLYQGAAVTQIAKWVEEISAYPEVPGKYMMYFEQSSTEPGRRLLNRLENYCPYHAGLNHLLTGPGFQDAVAQLFGEPAVMFKDKINFKLPGGGGFTPHQDVQAGWSRYGSLYITALISIGSATRDNGCLELVAGRHREGQLGPSWAQLPNEVTSSMEFVPCETAPGDVVFFDSFTPHRSDANLSDRPRRVLYVTYNKLAEGDQRARYYVDKRASYPPDCERESGKQYIFRV